MTNEELEAMLRRVVREELKAFHATRPQDAEPVWLDAIRDRLGKEKDTALAAEIGVHYQVVRRWRIHLGIERWYAAPPPKYLRSVPRGEIPAWAEAIRGRLGIESDTALAQEVGRSRERVRQIRATLGIPEAEIVPTSVVHKWVLTDEQRAWFGVLPDIEIARQMGCSYSQIGILRKRHKLPKSPVVRKYGRALDAFAHLYGQMPDAEIARRAGVSMASAAQYRCIHPELPPSPSARKK